MAALLPLVGEFYDRLDPLGRFTSVPGVEVPEVYRDLLAHEHHMTVTVERYHGCPVDVRVLEKHLTPTHYARKIVLTRSRDGVVVQFGIMRVALVHLQHDVRDEILAEGTPLGRILIENDVLRRIRLLALWRVEPGPDLQAALGCGEGVATFGRSALIECNHEPAVELLEIVAPVASRSGG